MTINYYLAWLHFDTHGKMSTRLPDGHRVLEVLRTSSSNRHPPALWVLVEAVVATPSYTPAFGFPSAADMPPQQYHQAPAPHPSMPFPVPSPVPSRTEQQQYDYGQQPQEGRTIYSELSQETRDDDWRSDTYGGGDFVPSIPMSPAAGTPSNGRR